MTQPSITIALGAERNTRMITITLNIRNNLKILRLANQRDSVAVVVERQQLSEEVRDFLSGK